MQTPRPVIGPNDNESLHRLEAEACNPFVVWDFVNLRTYFVIVHASIAAIDKKGVTALNQFRDPVCLYAINYFTSGILYDILGAIS